MKKKDFKYEQTRSRLEQIIDGMSDGEKLPNRTQLAQDLGIARTTLEHAIADLVMRGRLISKDGSGTYVNKSGAGAFAPIEPLRFGPSHYNKNSWALIVSSVLTDIYPYLVRANQDVAHKYGANLIICNTDNKIPVQDDYLYKLARDGVGGVVIVPSVLGDTNPFLFRALYESGMRIVSCYRPVPGFITPGVYGNNFESGYLAARYLLDCGCKRISYVGSPMYQSSFDRYQGYLMALRQSQLPGWGVATYAETFDMRLEDFGQTERMLERYGVPDGIFAFNDRIAQSLYAVLRKHGAEPGRDVQIIGCDDSSLCTQLEPRLTSIRFPIYETGRRAAEMLNAYLHDSLQAEDIHSFCCGCDVVPRASTHNPSDAPLHL